MNETWDAQNYARNFSFVPQYGRELIGILNPQKGEKILDLGCGTGSLTEEIAAHGCTVTGIDRDANMVALAQKTHPALTFMLQDAGNLTITGPFDGVFSNAALHWMDVGKVFPQIAKVMRKGGRFAAEMGGVHNIETIQHAIYKSIEACGLDAADFATPWHFPTPAVLAQKLEAAGFEIRMMHLFDRMTLLNEETGGVVGWVRMFGRAFLDRIAPSMQEKFLRVIEDEARATLFRDGQWYADYRRQHFVAIKL
jgi:trans-aconitate 2-methyltransferase